MANRAERRAEAKRAKKGIPSQYDQTRGRGRGGMVDEWSLQQKSIRLQDGTDTGDGPWKPSARTEADVEVESQFEANPNYRNPKVLRAPHSVRQWFRALSWFLIVLAAVAFLVIMWLPSHPMWLVITVAAVFVVGVVSLFFTAGNYRHNPNLDANGTAV